MKMNTASLSIALLILYAFTVLGLTRVSTQAGSRQDQGISTPWVTSSKIPPSRGNTSNLRRSIALRSVSANRTDPELSISMVNNYSGGQLYAYIVGQDTNGTPIILQANGSWYHILPQSTDIPEPISVEVAYMLAGQNETLTLAIPGIFLSGRIYVSEGKLVFSTVATAEGPSFVYPDWSNANDPGRNQMWAFIELSIDETEVYADLSYVDFISLPLTLSLTMSNGETTQTRGFNSSAVQYVCDGLQKFAVQESQPWDQLCQYSSDGKLIRVVSPEKSIAINNQSFSGYYATYVREVFERFSEGDILQIDGQEVTSTPIMCTTSQQAMNCSGANRIFPQPSTEEIFACDGIFSTLDTDNVVVRVIVARLCAAFQRSTLLLNGGTIQPNLPASSYYLNTPTNRYAQLVHEVELQGTGYAFPFDDVNPTNATDAAGKLMGIGVSLLTITVGDQ